MLVLTADSTTQARDTALTQGAQDYLTKPLDINEVALRMANLLDTRQLYDNLQRSRRWLAAFGELGRRLLTPGGAGALTVLTDSAVNASVADFAILVLPSGDGEVKVSAVSGLLDEDLTDQVMALAASSWATTIQTGIPELIGQSGTEKYPPPLDAGVGPMLVVPLTVDRVRGALTLGRTTRGPGLTADDLAMATSFASQASVALELVDAREAEVDLARREDRDRIAADLHDHVIQDLFAVGLGLQGLASMAQNPQLVNRILLYVQGLDRAIGSMRTTIFQLQPDRHIPSGLKTRILDIVDEHTAQLGYAPQVRFTGIVDHAVNEDLAGDVLAVVREGISNCARHAQASRLDISVAVAENILTLEITDDGRGIGTPNRSSGLGNMRRRAQRKGGSLAFTTPPPGGTRLTWKRSLT